MGRERYAATLLATMRIRCVNSARVGIVLQKGLQLPFAWTLRPGHIFCGSSPQEEVAVTPWKKILAPTDFSALSRPAVRYALEIGLERNAEVIVYHVLS